MTQDRLIRHVLKPLLWLLCLAPLAGLGWLAYTGGLTANPIEFLNRYLGEWALKFLLIALTVTPLRSLTGWAGIIRFRRLLGLFAFFYVVLYLSSYIGLDQFFNWGDIWLDIVKRTYITVGMVGAVILAALAATSTKGMIKRLGGKNWNRLHKLVYVAGAAGCLHFFMMRKGVQLEPIMYAGFLVFLYLVRFADYLKKRRRKGKVGTAPAA
ncbi:MAG: sulfoxide reductase heme-binding subunit YedZ [Rhodospirillales bacterium]|nr:sulfoxide reductase heme-binding subunit YedZ [Rhodospirillales bacterium]